MNITEQDITANGITLHVYQTQTGKPPIVFVHGVSDNGLCYLPIARQMANEYDIILYDSRGHGKSEAPETPATIVDRANDLAGLVQALGLNKPVLIGHSMGAVTVALFAGLYPDVPGLLVLEDPPPFEMLAANDAQDTENRSRWRAHSAANKQKTLHELIEINRQESPNWPEAEREPWAQSKQQFSMTVFDESYLSAQEGNQIVSQITCPVLLLIADPGLGALMPEKIADEWLQRLPDARLVCIPGAGHNIRRDQPQAFLEAVRVFLT